MARITEFETSLTDEIEIAISTTEFNAMIAAGGDLVYRIALYNHDGTQNTNATLSFPTTAGGWTFDADAEEYVSFIDFPTANITNFSLEPNTGATRYEGFGLFLQDTSGPTTNTPVEGYFLYNGNINDPSDYTTTVTNGPLAGTTFEIFDRTALTFTSTGAASVQWNLPNPDTPIVANVNFGDSGALCLEAGSLIKIPDGPHAPIDNLKEGDLVCVVGRTSAPIRWIGSKKIGAAEMEANPKLRPVRITAGALGKGLPERDLLVSRQHRMLVRSKIAERMFGVPEALIAAIKLTALPGIYVDEEVTEVEYFHLLFDQHEVIFAEGAPTESLFTGPEALEAVSPEAREEILALFPELEDMDYEPTPAAHIPTGGEQKQFINRHEKNNKALLC